MNKSDRFQYSVDTPPQWFMDIVNNRQVLTIPVPPDNKNVERSPILHIWQEGKDVVIAYERDWIVKDKLGNIFVLSLVK